MASIDSSQLWNKFFIFCLFNNMFLFIFYFAQTAVLPVYIISDLNGTVAQAGLAMTLFMVSSIVVRPFSGLIIEKFGKKKTFLVSELIFCLFSFAYLLADNLSVLLVIRFLHGIWFSILTTVCVPIANDFIPEKRKGEGMGYFIMSINLGLVLGPLLGLSLIQPLGYTTVALILATIICLGFAFCLLIPIREIKKLPEVTEKKKISLQDFVEKRALPASLMVMLLAFGYSSIMSYISTFAKTKGLLSSAGLFFVVFAVAMMSIRPFTGRLYDIKGPNIIIYPSIILFIIGLILLSQIETLTGLMISAIFIGMGFGSLQPCLQTLAIQRSPRHRIGHTTSTFFTLYDTGIALGAVLLGYVVALYGYTVMYLLCAFTIALSLIFYKFVVDRQKPLQP